jgi:branched-chain amino acid transport system ATP-binding protein
MDKMTMLSVDQKHFSQAVPAHAAPPILAIADLSVSYGSVEAVRHLSMDVKAGETVVLLGANGAGKSSTLNAIVGLAPRSGGTIVFAGQDVSRKSTEAVVRRGISLVPEGRRLFANMTVRENLRLGAAALGSAEFERERVDLEQMFPIIRSRAHEQAGLLSGGEQQQVAIARALLARPQLLLLDEPSLGLAPIMVNRIFDIIGELKRRQVTILLVEQNADRALRVADRAYVLANGHLELSGSAAEIRTSTLEDAYLGERKA